MLLEEKDFIAENRARIHDARINHIHSVLRSQIGSTLQAGKLNGLLGTAIIESMSDTAITLRCDFNQVPPKALPLTLVLALPRPQMLKRIVQNITEFGIKELHLIHSQKVEKSFWQTPNLKTESLKGYIWQGLEQAKDTQFPRITLHPQFKPFVEDILPSLCQNKASYIAHPYAQNTIPQASTEERLLVIGPEGGFSEYEVENICAQGVMPFSMGARIYKVENAVSLLSAKLFLE